MRRSSRARRPSRKAAEAPKATVGTAATALRGNPTSRRVQPSTSTATRRSRPQIGGAEDGDGKPKKPVAMAGDAEITRGINNPPGGGGRGVQQEPLLLFPSARETSCSSSIPVGGASCCCPAVPRDGTSGTVPPGMSLGDGISGRYLRVRP